MHKIYTTKGFIIDSFNFSERDKIFVIYTFKFGLIYARALGVRSLKSKLRYHLQDFNFVKVDLIKGKEFWRIVFVLPIQPFTLASNIEVFKFFKNFFGLFKKIVPPEEKSKEIFLLLFEIYKFFKKRKNFLLKEIKSLECLAILKLLFYLGYFSPHLVKNSQDFIISPITKNLVKKFIENKNLYSSSVKTINNILRQKGKNLP